MNLGKISRPTSLLVCEKYIEGKQYMTSFCNDGWSKQLSLWRLCIWTYVAPQKNVGIHVEDKMRVL